MAGHFDVVEPKPSRHIGEFLVQFDTDATGIGSRFVKCPLNQQA
jgi:hypothetical protein